MKRLACFQNKFFRYFFYSSPIAVLKELIFWLEIWFVLFCETLHIASLSLYIYIYAHIDIVAGVLQGDTLAQRLFIICLDYVLRTSINNIKENGFKLTKERSQRYPAETITDTDNADDMALLANAPAQPETLLYSLERAAAGIGLHVNAHKTEYMSFNQTGVISTLNGSTLKLVDKFTYLGSSFSSTETDIDTWLAKVWTATIGYRSYGSQTRPIKWSAVSSKQQSCRYCYMDAPHGR